jgi:hypothetical protein
MAKNVITIPATKSRYTAAPLSSKKKRRVAAYARVSTDHEDQQSSYEAQVDYYTHYIKSRDDWEFVSIYTDEGISATNTKKREGFKTMIADALAGKIDLIVTKSVSRFARNTVDSLTTVRKLKDEALRFILRKKTYGRWIPRANCSSPSCRALPRKRAVPFPRMSPGDSASAWRTARSALPTVASLVWIRIRNGQNCGQSRAGKNRPADF